MTVTAGQVTVDTTAGGTVVYNNTTANPKRVILNVASGGQTVFLGPSGVTTTTGLALAAGDTVTIDLRGNDVVYGIVAATTQVVSHLEV